MTRYVDDTMHCHLYIRQCSYIRAKRVAWILSTRAAKRLAAQNATVPLATCPEASGAARTAPARSRPKPPVPAPPPQPAPPQRAGARASSPLPVNQRRGSALISMTKH